MGHIYFFYYIIYSRPQLLSSWTAEKPLRCLRLHLGRPSQQSIVQMENTLDGRDFTSTADKPNSFPSHFSSPFFHLLDILTWGKKQLNVTETNGNSVWTCLKCQVHSFGKFANQVDMTFMGFTNSNNFAT